MFDFLEAAVSKFPRREGFKPSPVALHAAASDPPDAVRALACLLALENRLGGLNNLIVQLPASGDQIENFARRFPSVSWGDIPAADEKNELWWCDAEVVQRAFQRTSKNVIVFLAPGQFPVPCPVFREACEAGLREEVLIRERGSGSPVGRVAFRENLGDPSPPRTIEMGAGPRSFLAGFARPFAVAAASSLARAGAAGKLRAAAFRILVRAARALFPAVSRVAASKTRSDWPAGPEIHVVACAKYLEETLAAASTFAFFSGTIPQFVFHDDGSLDARAKKRLAGLLAGSRVVARSEADAAAAEALAGYPRCRALRDTLPHSLKFFDVPLFANRERVIVLDTDVLFYGEPAELVSRCAGGGAWFNEEVPEQYAIERPKLEELLGMEIRRNINSGVSAIGTEIFDFGFAERVLGICGDAWVHPNLVEQTLFALCASRLPGGGLLPRDYEISSGLRRRKDSVVRHYAAHSKFGSLFLEGVFDLLPRLIFARPGSREKRKPAG